MIDLRLPTGPLTTSTTRLPPFPPPPCPPPLRPSVRHRIDREVARRFSTWFSPAFTSLGTNLCVMCVYIHYGFRQGAAAGRVAPGSAHAVRAPKGGCAREGARAQHQSPCALFSIELSSVGCCKLAKQARAVSEGTKATTNFFQAQSTLLLLGLPYSYALLCRAVGGSCYGPC